MANQGGGASTPGDVGMSGKELGKPSPSQSLLQRLKDLREWQERQREELMEVLSHSNPSSSSVLTPVREESARRLSDSPVPRLSESAMNEDSLPTFSESSLNEDAVPSRLPKSNLNERAVPRFPESPLRAKIPRLSESPMIEKTTPRFPEPTATQGCAFSPDLVPHGAERSRCTTVGEVEVEAVLTCIETTTCHPLSVHPPGSLSKEVTGQPRLSIVMEESYLEPEEGHSNQAIDDRPTRANAIDERPVTPTQRIPDYGTSCGRGCEDDEDVWETARNTPHTTDTNTHSHSSSYPSSFTHHEDITAFVDESGGETSGGVPFGVENQGPRQAGDREEHRHKEQKLHQSQDSHRKDNGNPYQSEVSNGIENQRPHRLENMGLDNQKPYHSEDSFALENKKTYHSENSLALENEKPYVSEKYKSLAPSQTKAGTDMTQATKTLMPVKSLFCSVTQSEEGTEGGLPETPRPTHRYLRKGQGTRRFRMRPTRLRKAKRDDDDDGDGDEGCRPLVESNVAGNSKSPFRLPVRSLRLKETRREAVFAGDAVSSPNGYRAGGLTGRNVPPTSLSVRSSIRGLTRSASTQHTGQGLTRSPSTQPINHPSPTKSTSHQSSGRGLTRPRPHPLDLEKQRYKEEEELSAFEKLEELAEDSSFSSNSSTVWRLLSKGQQSVSSTPLRTPPPLALQETPVPGSLRRETGKLRRDSDVMLGELMDRLVPSGNGVPLGDAVPLFQQDKGIDIREILAQLKDIVRLEGHSISDITESDIQSFLDTHSQRQSILHPTSTPLSPQARPHHPTNTLMSPRFTPAIAPTPRYHPTITPAPQTGPHHPTSTPMSPQARPHHVHFTDRGVEVMEYPLSDTEDTLTDAASLDSDLVTTSDLEALAQFNGDFGVAERRQRSGPTTGGIDDDASSVSSDVTLTDDGETRGTQGQEAVVFTFSPPPPRPINSASDYIWSIFGKDRDAGRHTVGKHPPGKPTGEPQRENRGVMQETERRKVVSVSQANPAAESTEELEVHKTLLLAKVAELETETQMFKRENAKLRRLQEQAQEDRERLEEDRRRLEEEIGTERRKFQAYVDRERNALWKEKQETMRRPVQAMQSTEDAMEMLRLQEQIRVLREDDERRQSLQEFSVGKLNERIKALENDCRRLKERNNTVASLEKENQELRLRVEQAERGKGGGRAATQVKSARGRGKSGIRTVDGVAKALDRTTKQQPIVAKNPQINPGRTKTQAPVKDLNPQEVVKNPQINPGRTKTQAPVKDPHANPTKTRSQAAVREALSVSSRTKQDIANNNLVPGASDDGENATDERNDEAQPTELRGLVDDLDVELSPYDPPLATDKHIEAPLAANKHTETPLSPLTSLGYTEEAGLESTERVTEDGTREIIYANGNRKEIHPSGDVTISFYNGDRKEVRGDRTVYVYGSDQTRHTVFSDGKEEFVFPGGQRETRHRDGSSEISFPDGSRKTVLVDGTEISTTKDGSVVRNNPDGSQVVEFSSGQREVYRGGEKRREYPDGTVKILHADGRAETRYSTGRIRIKDGEGNLILDTHVDLTS